MTLTGRTDLWTDLRQIQVNPLIGVGFESFWVGERIAPLWRKYWWQPNQAHNGYYETYLNLGLIGLGLQLAMSLAAYRVGRQETVSVTADYDGRMKRNLGTYKIAFLLGLLLFNLTDATFKAVHPSFFMFFLIAVRAPIQERSSRVRELGSEHSGGCPADR
jgi:O-antigen ligase